MAKTLNACIFARVCFEALQITQSHKDNIHAHILFEQISFTRKVSLTPAHQQESHKCFVNIGLVENAGTRVCGYAGMRICGYADMRVCGYVQLV